MLENRNKGKIVIYIENDNGKINSSMEFRGIAKKSDVALTCLLVNFASLARKKGKNPKRLVENHLAEILKMLDGLEDT